MYHDKHVLLIAGGGTLGTYTAKELLRLGCYVDILCPEDKQSDDVRLVYHKGLGDAQTLRALFSQNSYDGIVNFIHYENIDDYKPIHKLLCENCGHLIFLSSYRVYADQEHPIREDAPQLADVSEDTAFVEQETYAIRKSLAERYIRSETAYRNYTIVRPVVSFSQYRFDLFMYTGDTLIRSAAEQKTLYLPQNAKDLTAGVDWAGNSGKLIANLLFKEESLTEAFTISSAQNLKWSEVAKIFSEIMHVNVEWVEEAEYLASIPEMTPDTYWRYVYDRCFDRCIDNTKVLRVTGLKSDDLLPLEEGLRTELGVYYRNREANN